MHDFRYVSKKEAAPIKAILLEIIHSTQNLVRDEFTFQYEFVGSASRNMITCDTKSNIGFDFDVNIYVNDDEENYTAKQIRQIIDASGAEIDIQDNGVVTITSNDQEGAEIAKRMIRELTFKPEVGMIMKGKVVRIIPIGAFVELCGGKDGMVHISQICQERIETIEPHVKIGDEVIVKIIKIDEKGRVNLTIKGVTEEEKAQLLNQ